MPGFWVRECYTVLSEALHSMMWYEAQNWIGRLMLTLSERWWLKLNFAVFLAILMRTSVSGSPRIYEDKPQHNLKPKYQCLQP